MLEYVGILYSNLFLASTNRDRSEVRLGHCRVGVPEREPYSETLSPGLVRVPGYPVYPVYSGTGYRITWEYWDRGAPATRRPKEKCRALWRNCFVHRGEAFSRTGAGNRDGRVYKCARISSPGRGTNGGRGAVCYHVRARRPEGPVGAPDAHLRLRRGRLVALRPCLSVAAARRVYGGDKPYVIAGVCSD